jgi:hypothetical protein
MNQSSCSSQSTKNNNKKRFFNDYYYSTTTTTSTTALSTSKLLDEVEKIEIDPPSVDSLLIISPPAPQLPSEDDVLLKKQRLATQNDDNDHEYDSIGHVSRTAGSSSSPGCCFRRELENYSNDCSPIKSIQNSKFKIFSSSSSCGSSSSSSSNSSSYSSTSSHSPSSSPTRSDAAAASNAVLSFLTLSHQLNFSLILDGDGFSGSVDDENDENNLAKSMHNFLIRQHEHHHHHHQQQQQQHEKKNHFRPINKMFKYDLTSLNVIKKEILLFLIESNYMNKILSPFDHFAYSRLTKLNSLCSDSFSNGHKDSRRLKFNYSNVRKLQKLLAQVNYDPLDRRFLKKNPLLPNCVSQLLMPFYFDIFSISEMQSMFNQSQLNLVLNLKRSYAFKTTHLILDYEVLTNYFRENIVWNCLLLFKQKPANCFDKEKRMAYLNFFFSFVYIQIHLESVVYYYQQQTHFDSSMREKIVKDHMKKAIELGLLLPSLLDSLILTGSLKHSEFLRFKKYYLKRKLLLVNKNKNHFSNNCETRSSISENVVINNNLIHFNNNTKLITNLEEKYFDNCYKSVENKFLTPLKLKEQCRLSIKHSLNKNYDRATISTKLNGCLPNSMKSYLLYDDEIGHYFLKNRNLFN